MDRQFQIIGVQVLCRRCHGKCLVPMFDSDDPPTVIKCPSCGVVGNVDAVGANTASFLPQRIEPQRR